MRDNGAVMTDTTPLPSSQTPGAPRFSVIVPAYNVEAFIAETLDSVLGQTLPDWELIIADDGSTDATPDILRRYADREPRMRVITQRNGGCSAASNTAIGAARGEYIAVLGADDLYDPTYLEQQAAFIDANPGYDIYSCNARKLFPDGSTQPYFTDARHQEATSFVLADWFESCPIFGLAVYRRDLALRLGGYRTDLRNAEDYDFWLRAMSSGSTHRHSPAELASYRRHDGNKSGDRTAAARALVRILQDLKTATSLSYDEREMLEDALHRRRAAIGRRELETRMLAGDTQGARSAFWQARGGFASRARFALALPLMLVSPRLYTALVLRRQD